MNSATDIFINHKSEISLTDCWGQSLGLTQVFNVRFFVSFFLTKIIKQNVNFIPYNIPLKEDIVLVFYSAKINVMFFFLISAPLSPTSPPLPI